MGVFTPPPLWKPEHIVAIEDQIGGPGQPWETFVREKPAPSLLVDVDGRGARPEIIFIAVDD
jgi:hypothetical protein